MKRMESSRDITAASSHNGGDVFTEEANVGAETPSIRNHIACKTGHILNNLTLTMWYSYALLYFQNVVGLYPTSAGILFFISQILTAVTLLVINHGRDRRLWQSFSAYGIRKARHVVGSAIILFAWPFIFTPCLFCEADSSNLALGMYHLVPVVLISVCWPLVEVSCSLLMKEMRTESNKDTEPSRFIVRVCQVWLYILLWALLHQSTEHKVNSRTREQFTHLVLILLPVGFLFVFAFHLTVIEPRPQADQPKEGKSDEDKNCEKSAADISSPSTIVNQELTRIDRPKLNWYEWVKEPMLYKVGFVVLFINNALLVAQCYLPLYLVEALQLRKEAVAFFPLIIVTSRIATEITCKSFIEKQKPRVVILCTTFPIFGSCMWFFLQSAQRTSLVYAPTVIFACTSSLVTMVTPNLLQEMTENNKEACSFLSGVFECLERVLLGLIVLIVQICYPDSKDRSVGNYLRAAFPAAFGSCIVVPMLVATAFMGSRNNKKGPELTITVASPQEQNEPVPERVQTALPFCADRLVSSETSTPPVDIEHDQPRITVDSNCAALQGSLSTAAPSDVETEEAQPDNQRDRDIEEVKRALDELYRLPSTDL